MNGDPVPDVHWRRCNCEDFITQSSHNYDERVVYFGIIVPRAINNKANAKNRKTITTNF